MGYLLHKFKNYYKGHIWCSLAGVIAIACILFAAVAQLYLKKAFTEYLTGNTIHSQQVILNATTENIANSLKRITDIGYEAAIDESIRDLAQQMRQDPGNAHLSLMMEERLNAYAHDSRWILGICVSDRDRIYHQYDKKQKSIRIWDVDSFAMLSETADRLTDKFEFGQMPKINVTVTQKRYPDQENHRMMHISVPLIKRGVLVADPLILTFTVDTEFLNRLVGGVDQSNRGVATAYLVDQQGMVIYHQNQDYVGRPWETVEVEREKLILQKEVGELGWFTYISIDEEKLLEQVDRIYYRGTFLMIAACAVAMAILIAIIWKVILKPLRVLIQGISEAGKAEKSIILIGGKNEIWQVAEAFNHLIVSLEKSNRKAAQNYREKMIAMKKQRNAELEALESQINAHFVCNTINIINYEAIEGGNFRVSELLKRLSNILRYTFDQKHQEVFFYQEILWVEQYLYLQKTRFEQLFDYEIDFAPEIQGWPCGKLILQPFVENSIIHGMEGKGCGGLISIKARALSENQMRIVIADNGKGIDPEMAVKVHYVLDHPYEKVPEGLGIGIANGISRIYQYFSAHSRIELENKIGEGCKFIFTLGRKYDKEG